MQDNPIGAIQEKRQIWSEFLRVHKQNPTDSIVNSSWIRHEMSDLDSFTDCGDPNFPKSTNQSVQFSLARRLEVYGQTERAQLVYESVRITLYCAHYTYL